MSDLGFQLDGSDPEQPQPGQEQISPDSLANPFLAKIPEADRAIVGKYIKDWDAGVTRRFQDIHSQYALMQMVNEDPQRVYDLLGQSLEQMQGGAQEFQQQEQQQYGLDGELPPVFAEKFAKMEQTLEALAQHFMSSEETRQAEQEDRELDDYLGMLKQKYGEFDEDWVLAKMLNGQDGEEALKQYNDWLQGQITSRMSSKRPVPVLGGGGSVPPNGVDATKMTGSQVRALVAGMLEQGSAASQ
jgi:hypothetical protein